MGSLAVFTDDGSNFNLSSLGYNLVDDNIGHILDAPGDQVNTDPLLNPLTPYPLVTPTHSLPANSPAVDAGSCVASGSTNDQRGLPRPFDLPATQSADDGCDIGISHCPS